MVWRLPPVDDREDVALEFGAALLSMSTDGAFGTRVKARYARTLQGALFRVDVLLPYDKPVTAADSEAQALLRYLTHAAAPPFLADAALVSRDTGTMFLLDSLQGRARVLSRLAIIAPEIEDPATYLQRHWTSSRDAIQTIARRVLAEPPLVIHARPKNPLKRRVRRPRN